MIFGNLNATIFIPVMLAILGIILIIFGALTYRTDKIQLYLKRCSEKTTAIIDGFDDRRAIERKKKDFYYYQKYTKALGTITTYITPIVLFTAIDGQQYRVTYLRPIEKQLSLGQKLNIAYNPENPYEIVIAGDKHMKVSSKAAIELGIGLIIGVFIYMFIL